MNSSKNNSLLAGVVGCLSIPLVLIGMGLFALSMNEQWGAHSIRPHRSSPSPTASPTPTPAPDERVAIRAAVRAADLAQSRALQERSTDGLERYYTGDALQEMREQVAAQVRNGTRVKAELTDIAFNDIAYTPGAVTVDVIATEMWTNQIVDNATGEPRGEETTTVEPQRETLVKRDGRWLISAVEHYTPPTPTPRIDDGDSDARTPQTDQNSNSTPDESADNPAASDALLRIQARYDARAQAFATGDLDGCFAYTAPEWAWSSEDGDHSTLAESREYYARVIAAGKNVALVTRIVSSYAPNDSTVVAGVLIGTANSDNRGRLIAQIDVWEKRDGDWYCIRERRLARTDEMDLDDLRRAAKAL